MILYTDRHKVPFQIDEDDYEAVSRYSWRLDKDGYVRTNIGKRPSQKPLHLHRFLLGSAPKGHVWDHVNRDNRDNRRENLRAVTQSKNLRNMRKVARNTSGARGVEWCHRKRRYRARIRANGKIHSGRYFRTLTEAARDRERLERLHWGENLGEQPEYVFGVSPSG